MTARASLAAGFERVLASGFVRAVAMLSAGQAAASAVTLLAAPVLGRLYVPADYGVLATYMALANVLGAVSTLQLHQAIISESSERRAGELVRLCLLAGLLVTAFSVLLAIFAVMAMPTAVQARWWMLMLPASTWAAAMTAAVLALANRHRKYAFLARVQLYVVLVTTALSILLGWFGWGAHGLLASYALGQLLAIACYLRIYRAMSPSVPAVPRTRLLALARRHRRFSIYSLPSEFLGTINQQLPVFALSALGAATTLGAFSRARQLVAMPMMLLGGSIALVFRQRAAEAYAAEGNCRRIYLQTFWMLLAIGIPPTLILIVIAPDLFRLFLGPSWGEAGEIARILAPMLLLRLVCSPLSSVFYIAGAQRLEFALSVLAALLIAVACLGPSVVGSGPGTIVWGYAIAFGVIYLAYVSIGWSLCGSK